MGAFPASLDMSRAIPAVVTDPKILGGKPVFGGTRVPVWILFDWLEGGESLDEFLANYPSVSRKQARGALRFGGRALIRYARRLGRVRASQASGSPARARRSKRSRTGVGAPRR